MAGRQARSVSLEYVPSELVRLDNPRPSSARSRNEYVAVGRLRLPTPTPPSTPSTSAAAAAADRQKSRPLTRVPPPPPPSGSKVISSQPGKQRAAEPVKQACPASVICRQCGRCRCAACLTPRPTPSRWLCNNNCLLSSESVVDNLSCLCCVSGCLYHAAPDDEESGWRQGAVCGCRPLGSGCCVRWSLLSCAALLLPCLCCYWPLKLCAKAYELGYVRFYNQGCRCRQVVVAQPGLVASSRRAARSQTLPPELPSVAAKSQRVLR